MLHVGDDDPDWLLRFLRLTTLWHLDLHSLVFGPLVASPIRFTDATTRTCASRPASLQRRCRGVRKGESVDSPHDALLGRPRDIGFRRETTRQKRDGRIEVKRLWGF